MAEAALALKDEGNKCLKAKDFDGAIAKYTEAIALDPTNHVFYSNRSAAHLSKGDANSALQDAEKCIEVKPDWPKGYVRKGAAHHSLKAYEEALKAYDAGLKIAPNDKSLLSGVKSVEKVMMSTMRGAGGGGNPLGQLFNAQTIAQLKVHPSTGPFFQQDPNFEQLLLGAGSNPNGMQLLQSEPRFMTCLQVLLGADPAVQQAQREAEDEKKRKEEAEVQATPKGYGSWAPPKEVEKEPEEEEELTAEQIAEKEQKEKEEAARQKVHDEACALKDEGNTLYKNKDFAGAIAMYVTVQVEHSIVAPMRTCCGPEKVVHFAGCWGCWGRLSSARIFTS